MRTSFLFFILLLGSCVSRREIDAIIWAHEKIPNRLCNNEPELKQLGVVRTVDCKFLPPGTCAPDQKTKVEFISYCDPQIREHLSANKEDVRRLLEQAGIKP